MDIIQLRGEIHLPLGITYLREFGMLVKPVSPVDRGVVGGGGSIAR